MDDFKIKEQTPQAWDAWLDYSGLRMAWHPFDDPKWYRKLYDFFDEKNIIVEIGVDLTLEPKYSYRVFYLKNEDWVNSGIGLWSDLYLTRQDAEEDAFMRAFKILENE